MELVAVIGAALVLAVLARLLGKALGLGGRGTPTDSSGGMVMFFGSDADGGDNDGCDAGGGDGGGCDGGGAD
jgi:hypothetical protein